MGWLWTLQAVFNVVLIAVVWRLSCRQGVQSEESDAGRSVDEAAEREQAAIRAEELVQYQEELGRLSAELEQQAGRLIFELEQKTRAARQLIRQMERESGGAEDCDIPSGAVAAPVGVEAEVCREETGAIRGRDIRQAVMQLEAQGCPADEIARRLKLGKREVLLLLSLHRRR